MCRYYRMLPAPGNGKHGNTGNTGNGNLSVDAEGHKESLMVSGPHFERLYEAVEPYFIAHHRTHHRTARSNICALSIVRPLWGLRKM